MFDDPNVVLHCEKIDKIYPGTKALDQVSFDLLKGKVNVLIGENGAGKSTLMKMIAGIEQPSAGKMYMDGEEVYFKDTNAARAKGIGIIHQELSLFQNMTVYQNIFMNHEKKKGLFLDDKKHIEGAVKILKRLEHEIPPDTMVGDLRVGQQQMVEIARNLVEDDLRVLIMDEPTSSLSAAEVKVLFRIMRELLEQGISIVYIPPPGRDHGDRRPRHHPPGRQIRRRRGYQGYQPGLDRGKHGGQKYPVPPLRAQH